MSLRRLIVAAAIPAIVACAGNPEASESQAPAAATGAPAAATNPDLARIDKARMMGPESAKVWLIMASDFQCPYCKSFHDDTWPRLEKEYVATGKIRVAFLNHPMDFHQLAIPAAEAAMCAGKQDKFWPMHDSLFMNQEKWAKGGQPAAVFEALATSLRLDMTDWRACVSSRATRAMIEADFARSKAGGVSGTPSFFIGNPPQLAIVGAESYAEFKKALDAAIAQAGR